MYIEGSIWSAVILASTLWSSMVHACIERVKLCDVDPSINQR